MSTQQEKEFWDEEMETMPLDKLYKLQEQRLQETVERAYKKTKFYRRLFDEVGVKPEDIRTAKDIQKLPFTIDIEQAVDIPLGDRLAIPEEEVRVFQSTSGTTGAVVPIAFSEKDEEMMCLEVARMSWMTGVRPWDVVQNLTGFDNALHGYKALGVRYVSLSAGRYNLDHQINMTKTAGVTVIEHLPSLVLKYFERMEQLGIKVKDTKLRMVRGVGEGWAESYKRKIENQYGTPFMTGWAAMEIMPFFAAECEVRRGMHVSADLGFVQVIEPETGEILPAGEEGELVVTTFNEAMPLIRYRIGDIGRLLPQETCPCGRTLPKMDYVKGRASQIIKVRGRKIMPIDVEEVIAKTEGLGDQYQIILDRPEIERLKVRIEHRPEVKDLQILRERVEEAFFQALGIEAEVDLVPIGSIERVTFKAQRIKKNY